ncbi:MAG: hypothetical protein J7L45_01065 [Candidatus Aenigmarchaeota archaeon]|nr:hypothetical protein [Candidatus Aenigmarchaeota archaeon]
MRKVLIIFLILMVSFPIAHSLKINVNIHGKLGGDLEYMDLKKVVNSTLQDFKVQWYNSGSVSCKVRMEFQIYKDGKYLESLWSKEKIMNPGISEFFETYWLPTEVGNYSVKLVVHHCYEVLPGKMVNFTVISTPKPKKMLKIRAKNLPDGKIKIDVESNTSLSDVVIIPKDVPLGWIFTDAKISKVENGPETTYIEYEPSVWKKEYVTLQAFTSDGKYSSEEIDVEVKKEKTLWEKYGTGILFVLFAFLIATNLYLFSKTKSVGTNSSKKRKK